MTSFSHDEIAAELSLARPAAIDPFQQVMDLTFDHLDDEQQLTLLRLLHEIQEHEFTRAYELGRNAAARDLLTD